jgi:hypothetical protein
MSIEYRTSDGNRIEVAANGHISTPKKVDLRSLGCPDWLASKVEAREVRREQAPVRTASSSASPAEVEFMRLRMRTAGNLRVLDLYRALKREHPFNPPYDYASLQTHMEVCASMAECAYATADTVEQILDNWPEDDEDNSRSRKRDLHRTFREAHSGSFEALSQACNRIAETMFHLSKVTNKTTSTGNGSSDD